MGEHLNQVANRGTIAVVPGSWEMIPPPDARINGSGHLHSNWDALETEVNALGYSLLVVSGLPTQDQDARRADHVQAAASETEARLQSPLKLVVGYSAGGATAERLPDALQQRGVDTQDVGLVLISGSMPPLHPADHRSAAIPQQRNTSQFRGAIRVLADGRTIMSEEDAARLIFDQVAGAAGETALRRALDNLQPQYRPQDDDMFLPVEFSRDTLFVWDTEEQVRSAAWVRAFKEAFRRVREARIENAGHAVHISQPAKLARILVDFAERELGEVSTLELPRQRQAGLYSESQLAE